MQTGAHGVVIFTKSQHHGLFGLLHSIKTGYDPYDGNKSQNQEQQAKSAAVITGATATKHAAKAIL